MISCLSIFVLAAHLIAVDLAMAGPLACIALGQRARRSGDAQAGRLEIRVAWHSMLALVVGIALGALQLGLLWIGGERGLFTALGQVPAARLWFALAEIVFFFGCMAAYVQIRRWPRRIPLVAGLLAVLAATDLAYHFPPLFAVLNLLGSRAELAGQELTSSLYRRLLLDPQVLAMVAHVWLAAVAVTGVAVMRLAAAAERGTADAQLPPENQNQSAYLQRTTAAIAARWALAASLAQMPVGLWLLLAVPAPSRGSLMGDDIAGTGLFVLAIVATFGLLHHLAAAAQGDTAPAQVRRSLALIVGIVLLMTAALDRSRVRDPDRADRFTSARRFSMRVCPQLICPQLGWPHSGWATAAVDGGSAAFECPGT